MNADSIGKVAVVKALTGRVISDEEACCHFRLFFLHIGARDEVVRCTCVSETMHPASDGSSGHRAALVDNAPWVMTAVICFTFFDDARVQLVVDALNRRSACSRGPAS